ncbi:hypothetical protein ACIA5C_45170 [Actinoplanes sp. NPDC051343]|uniref:hypothetical protein n=1 Tax=Actinoplanes sp. NPDC051343 TaxID=3363906 RepID=UPI00379A470E
MSRVIVCSNSVDGHVAPLLAVARDLLGRGHRVVFYTGSQFRQRVLACGVAFWAFPPGSDFDVRDLATEFPQWMALPPGRARSAYELKEIGIKPIPVQVRGLHKLLEAFPADVVISEQTLFGPFAAVQGLPAMERPKLVTLGILNPFFQSVDTAPHGTGLLPLSGWEGDVRNLALNAEARQNFASIQAYAEAIFMSVGAHLDGYLFDAVLKHSDYYLQLTVPGFEYPRGDLPSHFRFIGPIPPALGATNYEPAPWWPELSQQRPVVVVSQGTFANADLVSV